MMRGQAPNIFPRTATAAPLKAIPSIAIDVTFAWSLRVYVYMSSVTLVHPAKAAGRNDMPDAIRQGHSCGLK